MLYLTMISADTFSLLIYYGVEQEKREIQTKQL